MKPLFVTGIGTDVGKTIAATLLVNALDADYWKPVQAGYESPDREFVEALMSTNGVAHPEIYKLKMAASPHWAAREEGVEIDLRHIANQVPRTGRPLVIEGAGGLLVPLNEKAFVADLVKLLDARVILVSRNYLGSINHSLLSADWCRQQNLDVAGWIFNDEYGDYEREIAEWSGYPVLFRIPALKSIDQATLARLADDIKSGLLNVLDDRGR